MTTATATRSKRLARPVVPDDADLSHIIEPLRAFAVHVSALKPDPQNPQIHEDANLDAIAESMRTFGQDQPVIYRKDDGVIIKGNGRFVAAKVRLGWEYIAAIPVDDPKIRAAARGIADNQANRLAKSDDTLMAILVETIKADDDATLVASLGFTDKQVDAFLAGLATEQQGEDDLPKRRGRARTKRGDLWLMGDHRIICGSSTEGETLERLMHGLVAAMTLTDPPYGIDYEAESGAHEPIRGDRLTDDALINDLLAPAFTLAARHTRPDGAYYVFHSTNRRREFEVAMQRAGLVEHATIIWAKPSTACRGDYRYAHEPCFYAAKSDQRPRFFGDKAQQTVWRIGFATKDSPITVLGTGLLLLDGTGSRLYLAAREPKGRKMRKLRLDEGPIFVADEAGEGTVWEVTRDGGGKHPTQKPVEFCRRAIRNSSERDDIILDPFIGSGTTIMAADSIDRRCFGVEIDPRICDVAVARWEESAGRKAERQRPR